MKKFLLLFLTLTTLLPFSAALAEGKFITDRLEITLRSGPGTDYRIINMLKAGTYIDVAEESEGWSRVTAGDKEGWIISRYVTDTPPARPQLQKANLEIEKLNAENERLSTSRKKDSRELNSLAASKVALEKKLASVEREFEKWKEINAGVVTTKEENTRLTATVAAAKEELNTLRMENRKLKGRQYTYWFLSGGLLIVVGYILGHLYSGSRRGRSGGIRF